MRLRGPFWILGMFLFLALCSCASLIIEDVLHADRQMNEDQKRHYEELKQMGCIVVKNVTSSTVYLVVDGVDHGNIPPGRRVSITVQPGLHRLIAYTEGGRTRYSAAVFAEAPENGVTCGTWRIGE